MSTTLADWPTDVFRAMQARAIATVCTVPDGGLTQLLKMVEAEPQMRLVTLSTEPEGIGIATGCWLGGGRAMLAMQSSGVGNCINALGLPTALRAPCLMLVTMRGQWGEFNPWQVPMGQATRPALEAVGVKCFPVDRPEEVGETFAAAADLAFHSRVSAAVLVSQRIVGAKGFGQK
jgi:sulfopyruvate decarboxylase alpha subunit